MSKRIMIMFINFKNEDRGGGGGGWGECMSCMDVPPDRVPFLTFQVCFGVPISTFGGLGWDR